MEGIQNNLEITRFAVEKILDTFLGQDNKIYYKVRWQETWEPEERVMAMCAPLLNEFWKDYYAKTQQQQQQEVRNVQQQAQQQNQRIQQGNNQPIVQTKEQELITHSIADLTTTMLPSAVGNGCPPEPFPEIPTQDTTNMHTKLIPQGLSVDSKSGKSQQNLLPLQPPEPAGLSEEHVLSKQVPFPFASSVELNSTSIVTPRVPDIAGITNMQLSNKKISDMFFQPRFVGPDAMIPTKFTFTPSFVHFSANLPRQNIINIQQPVSEEQKNEKTKTKTIFCKICHDMFDSQHLLNKHLQDVHSENNRLTCGTCGKSFEKKATLNRHMLSHTSVRPYKCQDCGKGFKEKSNLTKHSIIHTGLRPHACDICNARFRQLGHLLKHVLVHKPDKPFNCDICKKGFKRKEHLKDHLIIHSGNFPFECEICHKKFRFRTNLKVHSMQHNSSNKFVCDICNKAFPGKANLTQHMLIHSAEFNHKCELCGKTFKRKGHLRRHMETHKSDKSLNCPFCKVDFLTKSDFRKHMLTHTGGKPFVCSLCSKRFVSNFQLQQHTANCKQRKEHENLLKCQHCYKVFKCKPSLEKHISSHKFSFQCSKCLVDFKTKTLLKKHSQICVSAKPLLEKSEETKNALKNEQECSSKDKEKFDFQVSSNDAENSKDVIITRPIEIEKDKDGSTIFATDINGNENLNLPTKVF